jgi:hypothetical protein
LARIGLLTVVAVFLSPLLVCRFFVRPLFAAGELVLALVYSGFLLPCLMFLKLAWRFSGAERMRDRIGY